MDVHINLLKHTLVPFSYGTDRPSSSDVPQIDYVPWRNTRIRITKGGQGLRTRPAVVTDVLCNQATPSGLKVQIQLTTLDAVNPFGTLVLDYDDVVVDGCVVFNHFGLLLI